MHCRFMKGKGTPDVIFIMWQLHEKYIGKRKDLYFMFVDLEKAFDRIPRKMRWWPVAAGLEKTDFYQLKCIVEQ